MNIIFYPILGSVFWLKYLSVSKSLSKMYFGPKYIFENDILGKVGYFKIVTCLLRFLEITRDSYFCNVRVSKLFSCKLSFSGSLAKIQFSKCSVKLSWKFSQHA